ncbi:MAG: hypothetical protein HN429_01150 [Candidatus Magasanikbacteria bacterium]|nr:hypothetical protein [Candidatus Magasanikbacteria bacterium]
MMSKKTQQKIKKGVKIIVIVVVMIFGVTMQPQKGYAAELECTCDLIINGAQAANGIIDLRGGAVPAKEVIFGKALVLTFPNETEKYNVKISNLFTNEFGKKLIEKGAFPIKSTPGRDFDADYPFREEEINVEQCETTFAPKRGLVKGVSVKNDTQTFTGDYVIIIPDNSCTVKEIPEGTGAGSAGDTTPPPKQLEDVQLTNPIGGILGGTDAEKRGVTSITELVGRVMQAALGILGSLAMLAFFFGGVMWLVSAGNQERVKRGFSTMLYASIGILVVFASYAILQTIISGIAK